MLCCNNTSRARALERRLPMRSLGVVVDEEWPALQHQPTIKQSIMDALVCLPMPSCSFSWQLFIGLTSGLIRCSQPAGSSIGGCSRRRLESD